MVLRTLRPTRVSVPAATSKAASDITAIVPDGWTAIRSPAEGKPGIASYVAASMISSSV